MHLFCVCVALCVGSGLAWADPPSKGSYRLCIRSRKWKNGQGPTKGCRAKIIIIIIIIIIILIIIIIIMISLFNEGHALWSSSLCNFPTSCYFLPLLYIYGSIVLLLDLCHVFSFLILYTVGRIPWTGDQPVARLLPTHRATQTRNKRTQTSVPWVGPEPTIPAFERAKTVHALGRAATVIGLPSA
jgi:hypothetical protein